MSDNDLDDDETTDPSESPVIRDLRKQVKTLKNENRELAARATAGEEATRKMAFLEAGVDLNDPKTGYFVKGYDGELTADAIKTAAVDAGFMETPEPSTQPEDDSPALGRILDATANGRTPPARRNIDDEIAQAERDGDHATARQLKHQKVSTKFFGT